MLIQIIIEIILYNFKLFLKLILPQLVCLWFSDKIFQMALETVVVRIDVGIQVEVYLFVDFCKIGSKLEI